MDAKGAMKLVVNMAKNMAKSERQIMYALGTAKAGYEVCGPTQEWEDLMQALLDRAIEKNDSTLIAMVAQVYENIRQQEIQPA